jgi:hypothetical protein
MLAMLVALHNEAEKRSAGCDREHVFTNHEGRPHKHNLMRKFYGTCKRAGITDGKRNGSVDLHSLRVTFTAPSLEGGAGPKAVPMILGHATLDMTMRVYAKATDRSMRDAVNALPFATARGTICHRIPTVFRTRIGEGGMALQTTNYQTLTTEPGGTRTHDLRIKSPLLYQLSYELARNEG